MKLAYHSSTSMKSDLRTDILSSAKAGFKGLELKDHKIDEFLKDHSLLDLKGLLRSNNIEPIAINSLEYIAFQGGKYQRVKDYCLKYSKIASEIECPSMVVVPSPTPRFIDGQEVLDLFWNRVVVEYVTVLRELSDIAKPYGIKLAFEFLGFGWCSVRTPRGAYEIISETGRENVGLNFDACHFYAGGGLLNEIDQINPKKLIAFHINDLENVPKEAITDSKRLMPGLGIIPLDDICSKLSQIGFNGVCTVELFRPEYWEWDPDELAKKCYECTVEVLTPYFPLE
jgi:2-keto-myo-inositol isomerase